MKRHGLVRRAPAKSAMSVIERLCGLHAQVASSAEAMLAVRVAGDPSAQELLDRGELVKTWSMRGTLHLLPAHEYGMWQAAFSTYDHFLKPAWSRASGLWPDDVERADRGGRGRAGWRAAHARGAGRRGREAHRRPHRRQGA